MCTLHSSVCNYSMEDCFPVFDCIHILQSHLGIWFIIALVDRITKHTPKLFLTNCINKLFVRPWWFCVRSSASCHSAIKRQCRTEIVIIFCNAKQFSQIMAWEVIYLSFIVWLATIMILTLLRKLNSTLHIKTYFNGCHKWKIHFFIQISAS